MDTIQYCPGDSTLFAQTALDRSGAKAATNGPWPRVGVLRYTTCRRCILASFPRTGIIHQPSLPKSCTAVGGFKSCSAGLVMLGHRFHVSATIFGSDELE